MLFVLNFAHLDEDWIFVVFDGNSCLIFPLTTGFHHYSPLSPVDFQSLPLDHRYSLITHDFRSLLLGRNNLFLTAADSWYRLLPPADLWYPLIRSDAHRYLPLTSWTLRFPDGPCLTLPPNLQDPWLGISNIGGSAINRSGQTGKFSN